MKGNNPQFRELLLSLSRSLKWQGDLGRTGVSRVERGKNQGTVDSRGSDGVTGEESAGQGHTLDEIREQLGDCQRCKLSSGRKNIVFGVGNPGAELMFIGEAPGADEDSQGEPFVGRAGQLLTRMIQAMGLTRESVYIANIIKCRPPQNRDPEMDEVEQCEPFLVEQIQAIKPRVIVSLGRVAAGTLLKRKVAITRERGNWHEYHGVKMMLTLHPAYLLRTPSAKRDAWNDLQAVMDVLGLGRPGKKG